ncbi:MAG TPA: hypothetical protein VL947_06200 [Cytophagales bacterium]|nr:hypothetical protein [Cytophagales bacterium]
MKYLLLTLLAVIATFCSCQKKKVAIDFEQRECKGLTLKNARYELEKSPCDASQQQLTHKKNTVFIWIEHNNKESCLEFFTITADFLRANGSVIPAFPGKNYKDKYKSSDPEITLTDQYIRIAFTYEFFEGEELDMRTIKINLRLENELRDDPRLFSLTIPLNCIRRVSNTNYHLVQDVHVTNNNVSLSFRDYSSIDGDIINVYLNGALVIPNLTLTGSYQNFNFTINPGHNELVVVAVNEGSSTPNTCEIRVNNGAGIDLTPGLNTGQGINIIF